MVACVNCGLQFEKAEKEIKRTKNNFCSRSCSVSFNNKRYPKRVKTNWKCLRCNSTNRPKPNSVVCSDCHIVSELNEKTLFELIQDRKEGYRRNIYDAVRAKARKDLEELRKVIKVVCEKCGYDKTVQVCHVKPISSFSLDTKVKIVNSRENIKYLCPNCHWELDNL